SWYTHVLDVIFLPVSIHPRPPKPVQCSAINQTAVWIVSQNSYLLLKFVRHPHVIGIQKSQILALCVIQCQITRSAGPPIHVSSMLEITDAIGVTVGTLACKLRALVRRSIIHQQKLPIDKCLLKDARNCLGKESLCVEEWNYHGDCRFVCHSVTSFLAPPTCEESIPHASRSDWSSRYCPLDPAREPAKHRVSSP